MSYAIHSVRTCGLPRRSVPLERGLDPYESQLICADRRWTESARFRHRCCPIQYNDLIHHQRRRLLVKDGPRTSLLVSCDYCAVYMLHTRFHHWRSHRIRRSARCALAWRALIASQRAAPGLAYIHWPSTSCIVHYHAACDQGTR